MKYNSSTHIHTHACMSPQPTLVLQITHANTHTHTHTHEHTQEQSTEPCDGKTHHWHTEMPPAETDSGSDTLIWDGATEDAKGHRCFPLVIKPAGLFTS